MASAGPRATNSVTPRDLIVMAAERFADAGLHFGHGTDNALDEAAFIVLHALGLPPDADDATLARRLDEEAVARTQTLVFERIRTRRPAAYLTQRMWFAGHEFFVDERVLVPRSPIAELIAERFQPWLGETPVRTALDIGTGSGCIAVAVALAFPEAQVHATDVSADALIVAALNRDRYDLAGRLVLHEADLFPAVPRRFDLIVSNPPYVPAGSHAGLPAEYGHEPRMGLIAGVDGMDCVARILGEAARHLSARGLLVVEVGEIQEAVERRFGRMGLTWVDLTDGGEGVFVVRRDELRMPAD